MAALVVISSKVLRTVDDLVGIVISLAGVFAVVVVGLVLVTAVPALWLLISLVFVLLLLLS
jgi:hypothetical protein